MAKKLRGSYECFKSSMSLTKQTMSGIKAETDNEFRIFAGLMKKNKTLFFVGMMTQPMSGLEFLWV